MRDARVVFEANPNYWQPGTPKLQRLIFLDIPELSGRVTALETGEIDITMGLPPEEIKRLKGNTQIKIDTGPTYFTRFLWINPTHKPFDDVKVRKALQHALNLNAVTSSLLAGIAIPAKGPIGSNVVCADRPETVRLQHDPGPPIAHRSRIRAGVRHGHEVERCLPEGA